MPTLNNCMTALRILNARAGRKVSTDTLMAEMEVSRATVIRTIDFMRVQWRLTIEAFPDGGYLLRKKLAPVQPHDPVDRSFMVPGLHISEGEAYQLLMLLNASNAIDPGLMQERSMALRGLLKQLLSDHDFDFRGINRKLRFELPGASSANEIRTLRFLAAALLNDSTVILRLKGSNRFLEYSPQYLAMTRDGWQVQLFRVETQCGQRCSIGQIAEISRGDKLAVRQPGVDDAVRREEQRVRSGDE